MMENANRTTRTALILVLLGSILFGSGCATTPQQTGDLPPVLAQDELQRPYAKLGVIEVRRERYGAPEDRTDGDGSWGYLALRQEAAKMGADAVIFPEIRAEKENYIFFPSSEITAKGIAIKFR